MTDILPLTLDSALAAFYADHVVRGTSKTKAAESLKTFVSTDDGKSVALARLGELNKLADSCGDNLSKRCYVSYVQKMALDEVLNG